MFEIALTYAVFQICAWENKSMYICWMHQQKIHNNNYIIIISHGGLDMWLSPKTTKDHKKISNKGWLYIVKEGWELNYSDVKHPSQWTNFENVVQK